MVHLIGFSRLDSDLGQAFQTLYQQGDICVFSDSGLMLADTLPLNGPGYLLEHDTLKLPQSPLPVLNPDGFIALVAEHGPLTSWFS